MVPRNSGLQNSGLPLSSGQFLGDQLFVPFLCSNSPLLVDSLSSGHFLGKRLSDFTNNYVFLLLFEKAWSDPHWWKATCLLKMWKDIHTKGIFENTWTYSYWQKATWLFKMWQDIHTIGHFKKTGIDPHWSEAIFCLMRKALCLLKMCQDILPGG